MVVTDSPYVERLLENAYVQDNLLEAMQNLRRAYERAQKRRVEPARDSKIRHQLRQAALSLTEAGEALKSGRRKPRKRWPKRVFVLIGAIGVAAALAGSEDLRRRLVGDDSFAGQAE
jgi:hypothetical protein